MKALERAIQAIGQDLDKAQTESSGPGVLNGRQIYLWGLQDGYRRAIEILDKEQKKENNHSHCLTKNCVLLWF